MPMKTGVSDSALAVAGLDAEDERVYRCLLRAPDASVAQLAVATGMSVSRIEDALERCAVAGLVQPAGAVATPEPPGPALGALIAAETRRIQSESARLDALRNLVPSLLAEHLTSRSGGVSVVDVEAVEAGDVVELLRSLAHGSQGDLMWFRPDQWRLPISRDIDALVRELMASGRRSRAIYPARVLEEAPDVVRTRAEAGELVRIMAEVPSRMSILGSAALMSDRWGTNTGRRLVVREHALVGALAALFESVWEQAMAVPGLDDGAEAYDGGRRLLLQQLTQGAKDEQIARMLGLSLRTVRRRIAEIMTELGAASRFQAGVEAVRRGWI